MAAVSTRSLEELEAQARVLLSVFTNADYETVAPAIIQPADVFLDVVGESLRARTYVFTDPDGAELCLRPDLTVPTCRLHLARYADPGTPARYCYNGAAFRFQPQAADARHPREFRQAGIERFGDRAREEAEAETVAIVIKAIESAGLKDWSIRLGDLGLFSSVLDVAGLSPRWKKRLDDAFLKPLSFREALKTFAVSARSASASVPDALLSSLRRDDRAASEAAVAAYLDEKSIELIGTRALADITAHLIGIAEDREEKPLDAAAVDLIKRYVGVSGPATKAGAIIDKLLNGLGRGSGTALEAYDRRLALLANSGIDLDRVTFSAEFGRTLAYYTGLVFEVHLKAHGPESPIAAGGRYDGLMRAAGAGIDVPAVGAAIHTERLWDAVRGGAQ
ncbi:MAG TPA: ATP phosphoribosyltransferase regulatory subunit [Hyphomicrobium sp.]|jgi:ATP phosphoribosyltransferase regulatory subunit|uniref:ATP phosphoribosyltransferase regulatory subunit n=1 Tax=Hyphomicrobium sp. TaxID=82 RepID=UPI002CF5CFE9|nr:ATP phosphoribosyltransferase regulatory subunit [Hyphomicrobium sp.]HXE01378.1 ATP phosphoribosyltransferase regulatory subunit [Hyphomicrobium sp.]